MYDIICLYHDVIWRRDVIRDWRHMTSQEISCHLFGMVGIWYYWFDCWIYIFQQFIINSYFIIYLCKTSYLCDMTSYDVVTSVEIDITWCHKKFHVISLEPSGYRITCLIFNYKNHSVTYWCETSYLCDMTSSDVVTPCKVDVTWRHITLEIICRLFGSM